MKKNEVTSTKMRMARLALAGVVVTASLLSFGKLTSAAELDATGTAGGVAETTEVKNVALNLGATQTDMAVTWYSSSDTSNAAKLQYTAASNVVDGVFPTDPGKYTEVTATSKATAFKIGETDKVYYTNSAKMTELTPGTEYVYRVSGVDDDGSTVVWSKDYTFTCETIGENNSFGFIVAGDPQIGTMGSFAGAGQQSATDQATDLWTTSVTTAKAQFPNANFLVSLGDQIDQYASTDSTGDKTEGKTYAQVLSAQYDGFLNENSLIQTLPLVTAVGNHDNGNDNGGNYTTHFTTPSNNANKYGSSDTDSSVTGEEDYYYTYGNTLFMVLNTTNTSAAEHKSFIQEAKAACPNATWKVVIFHKSIYSVASHVTEDDIQTLRTGLSPVFQSEDIDLVLQGHDHVYARSYIMGGKSGMMADVETNEDGSALTTINNPDGVQYVTLNSSSGSKYYNITSEAYTYTAVQNQEKTPNYSYVSVDDDELSITTYRQDNSIVDQVTLTKDAQQEMTGTTSYEKTYGDAAFTLDTATTNTENGAALTYKSSDEKVATVDANGKVSIVGAGDATITVSAAATENFVATDYAVKVSVAKKAQTISSTASYTKAYGDQTFALDAKTDDTDADAELTYRSSDKKVATVDADGEVTIKGVGKATITVKSAATENYKAATAKTVTIEVTQKDIKDLTAKLAKTSYTYNGKNLKPVVSISGMTKDVDYTVTYKNNKSIGKATVTITGKGNYTGTLTKTFKINPAGTTVSKLNVKSSSKIQVKWTKKSGVTGYQIRYSTSSKYAKAKTQTITVKNAKTVKNTLKKLNSGKKYYVQIRTYKTVSKTNYYSSWSKTKTATTTK